MSKELKNKINIKINIKKNLKISYDKNIKVLLITYITY